MIIPPWIDCLMICTKLRPNYNFVFNYLMIKTDITDIPTPGSCYNVPKGDIYENMLKEIWKGLSYSDFMTNLLKAGGQIPACHRCCSAF
jgi:Fe-coproporphyrin III synthase